MNPNSKSDELFSCPECGLHYTSEATMKKCAAWCAQHKSCNLEITKDSEESKESSQE